MPGRPAIFRGTAGSGRDQNHSCRLKQSLGRHVSMETFARVLLDRAGDGGTGLLFEDERHTWADVVRESRRRAALTRRLLTARRPPHIGVLLDNVPEYVFW